MLPSQRYQALISERGWQADSGQLAVLPALDRIALHLIQPARRRWWQRAFRPSFNATPGLYLWGGVGRGKTLLMDLLVDALAGRAVRRYHFHRLMEMVHQRLAALKAQPDPLAEVAKGLAGQMRLLCLDELYVSDIADAMVLGRLLEQLQRYGVILVCTSNIEPDGLYQGGLQRERFLPTIALLKRTQQVVEIATATDYRLRSLERAPVYFTPLTAAHSEALLERCTQLAPSVVIAEGNVEILGRKIAAQCLADDVALFRFAELCEGPRSQRDYIELARRFHTVLIDGVPQIASEDVARRFIALIDEFYERRVKLVMTAAAEPAELYQGEQLAFAFERCVSRLIEMRSHDYLKLEHLG